MAMKRTKTEGELLEELQSNGPDATVPWMYRWTKVSHYYGDYVRELLIICAVLMLVTAPFYTDRIAIELPLIVVGAVAMVWAAALTSPWKESVIRLDAVASGVGLIIFELWALWGYESAPMHKFVLRQAIAIICLFALYFSTKTMRNMILKTIGRPDMPVASKTERMEVAPTEAPLDWKQQAHDALEELNETEKRDFTD